MMYFAPQHVGMRRADPKLWGQIITPLRFGKNICTGFIWIADNGCFSGKWDEGKWLRWLDRMLPFQASCLMATAPDVVGDAQATLERFAYYAPMLRERGWPVGFVAQDGMEALAWPDSYDVLFVGGTTDWKLGSGADKCIRIAQRQGKWVHVGRVNSVKRIKHFLLRGANSVDGTTLCFQPTQKFKTIDNALREDWRLLLD